MASTQLGGNPVSLSGTFPSNGDLAKEFKGVGIQVLNGRFGPYITDGKKNGKIPKDVKPEDLTLEDCQEILAKAPAKRGGYKKKK